jgi:HK97 gp10 family phage protein
MAVGSGAGKFVANVYVKGFNRGDQLPRLMRKYMTLQTREKELIAAMKRAAKPMKEMMENLAPVRTGALSRSYAMRKLVKTPPRVIGIRVGAVSGKGVFQGDSFAKAGWRDHFAELGTVNHAPQPHVRPAINATLGTYRLNLGKELAAILRKLRTI